MHIIEALKPQSRQGNFSDYQRGAKVNALSLPTISQARCDSDNDAEDVAGGLRSN